MMTAVYILLGILAFLTLSVFAIAYITYHIAFHSPDKVQNDIHFIPPDEQTDARQEEMIALIDSFNTLPSERVTVTSHDGLVLSARLAMNPTPSKAFAICCHGYRGTSERDFCGAGRIPYALGQNLLLIDQRGCRMSEGHTITFGINERRDVMTWIDYLLTTFGEEITISLYGASMGAATVLLASAMKLPPQVTHIAADSSYTSPYAIIEKVCRVDRKLPPKLAMPFLVLGAKLFAKIDIHEGDVCEAVKQSPVKILLIHGERDSFVPTAMGKTIAAAAPDIVTLHTFPGAGHVLSYITDQPRYEAIVIDYLSKNQTR